MHIISDLEQIQCDAERKEEENELFVSFLKQHSAIYIDDLVKELNHEVTPQIDCTKCGNCCKTLMIQVEKIEIEKVSRTLNLTHKQFEDKYIESGSGDQQLMNMIPCAFLSGSKCSIYNERFSSCREFPALEIPFFTKRLFTVFMHYGRCPIIFNVIEGLKINLKFNEASFQQD